MVRLDRSAPEPDCVFCKIISGDIPTTAVYRDELVTAFRDLNPQAPTHVLIVPNHHVESVKDMDDQEPGLSHGLMVAANKIAADEGLTHGYRLVTNVGADAGQSVFHLHWHLLGGRRMSWPPG
ncbi:MAG: histidine triad nucleotide-binding protein [Chloroflexota bacterium]